MVTRAIAAATAYCNHTPTACYRHNTGPTKLHFGALMAETANTIYAKPLYTLVSNIQPRIRIPSGAQTVTEMFHHCERCRMAHDWLERRYESSAMVITFRYPNCIADEPLEDAISAEQTSMVCSVTVVYL